MTRTRNTNFGGTTPPDVDVDVPAYTSIVREIVQDANLLYDKITGENGIATDQVIAKNGYTGAGTVKTGPPTRRPVMAQEFFKPISDPAYAGFQVAEADYDLYGGRCHMIAVPFFVPLGETDYQIDLIMEDPFGSEPEYEVRDSTWAIHQQGPLYRESLPHGEGWAWRNVIQFPTPGQYYLLIQATCGTDGGFLERIRVYPNRVRSGAAPILPTESYNPFPVGTPSTELYETIHDEMIADNYPVAGWVVTTLNRNVNWLLEQITGGPVVGNSTRSLSTLWDHTRRDLASEGQIQYVLHTEALGAVQVNSAGSSLNAAVCNSAETRGCLSWPAIIPKSSDTTRRTFHRFTCYVPAFADNPRIRVLAAREEGKGDPEKWRLRVTTAAGSSSVVAFAYLDAGVNTWVAAEVNDVLIDAPSVGEEGTLVTFELEVNRNDTTGIAFGEFQIVGYQIYFDPS